MNDALFAIHRRPGRLWTVLQFPLTRFVLAVLAVALPVVVLQIVGKQAGIRPHSLMSAMVGLLTMSCVLASYTAYVHLIERRAATELARGGAWRQLGKGALVGASLFCATMLILRLAGAWRYTGLGSWGVLPHSLLGALMAGVFEETMVRGVLFRMVEEGLGSWIALALSALIFGLLHAFNPGATAISTAAIGLEAGVLLAAAYMYARRLWLCIGLHAAWNFTEGGVFAASVSGTTPEGLLGVRFSGPELLTGGKFGPEASLVSVLVCLAAGLCFLILARRAGRVIRPSWRRT